MIYIAISIFIVLSSISLLILKCHRCQHGEKVFQQLINHINIGYYKYRPRDGVVLEANKGFVKILELNMSVKEVLGRSLSELLIYVDDKVSIREQVKTRGELRNYEYHFKTLEGKDKCVLHNSYMIKDPLAGEGVIVALIEDITEERLSYEKMKTSQERYEKIFKNSGDMVIVFRIEGFMIEEVNPVTEVITGFPEDELLGSSFAGLLHPSKRETLKDSKNDLLFTGSARLETVMVMKSGAYKEVILTMSIVELKDKKLVMTVIKDVSALIKEKEEHQRRKKELEDFWKASVKREERIKNLRAELERLQMQVKLLKEKHEPGEFEKNK